MRPVRFVALSEDGQALILTDEVGRMLSLAVDEQLVAAVQREKPAVAGQLSMDVEATLTPRDIQARIRSGDSAEQVARLANAPMEKILRFAGPVLQERAAMAQLARRTRLRGADSGQTLADVADARLRSHGIDVETVAWDAYRRDDGGWRVTATWPSGKATAHAVWDLDRPRSMVAPVDDMAQFLSAERQQLLLAQEEPTPAPTRLAAASRMAEDADPAEGPAVPPLSVLRRRDDRRDDRRGGSLREPSRTAEPASRSAAEANTVELPDLTRPASGWYEDAPARPEPPPGQDPLVAHDPRTDRPAARYDPPRPDGGRSRWEDGVPSRRDDVAPARREGVPPRREPEPRSRREDGFLSRRDDGLLAEPPAGDDRVPTRREPTRRGEDWREGLDQTTPDPPAPAQPQRARKADLPSWDDILFGTGSRRGQS